MIKRYRSERGQSLLEFALILMVMFFIGVAALDFGRVFFATIVITNASREGARYLTLHPDDSASSPIFDGTKAAAVAEAQGSMVSLSPSNVTVTYCLLADALPGCDKGFPVEVTVNYNFQLSTSIFFPSTLPLSRSTRMLVP